MADARPRRWDIFCKVVDNFGDVGVCWRLARQIAHERGRTVRMWVDDLATFQRMYPDVLPDVARQRFDGVEIGHWGTPWQPVDAADVVVETFGCDLPAQYVEAMAARQRAPAWVNLDYLSAESWIEGCHLRPSPHPRLSLVKYYFFPGFSRSSGGLLREAGLAARRRTVQDDPEAFWRTLDVAPPSPRTLCVSLFSYENAALGPLLSAWAQGAQPILCLAPEGKAADQAARWAGWDGGRAGQRVERGALRLEILPFLPQDRYDALLWTCDVNFVRGEDSFIRAQWAERPMLWHAYPQSEGTHRIKLAAFLNLYCEGMPAQQAAPVRAQFEAWNRCAGADQSWPAFLDELPAIRDHARRWTAHLESMPDLVTQLDEFVARLL